MKVGSQCSTRVDIKPFFIKMGPAPMEGPTQVQLELTFEFFSYSKRIKSKDAGERAHDGDTSPLTFHKRGKEGGGAFL